MWCAVQSKDLSGMLTPAVGRKTRSWNMANTYHIIMVIIPHTEVGEMQPKRMLCLGCGFRHGIEPIKVSMCAPPRQAVVVPLTFALPS
jgi:hypothetical protein